MTSGFDDDSLDPELLSLFRQNLLLTSSSGTSSSQDSDTGVLADAKRIYEDAVSVAIDYAGTKSAAREILTQMKVRNYSTKSWVEHDLHPKEKSASTVEFIFTLDLLNFCFWPDDPEGELFTVEYEGKQYTGYWSLVAVIRRALDEGIPITSPCYWQDEDAFTYDGFEYVFRSCNGTKLGMLDKRFNMLRHAGQIMYEDFSCSVLNLITAAKSSAPRLVNLLVHSFPQFRDSVPSPNNPQRNLRFYKRAQIFVADLWACFDGQSYGSFHDIDKITMFADYRIPQMLYTLNCLKYSPALEHRIRSKSEIEPGSEWEIELRGCSIWCVELIREEILAIEPEAKINAILIDFFLYDLAKEKEKMGEEVVPHHRCRSIWY